MKRLVGSGVAALVLLVLLASPFASSEPDGLQRVAADEGFADTERAHDWREGPFAGYSVDGVADEKMATGLAGAVGVLLAFLSAAGLFAGLSLVRRRREGRR